jgi:phage tail sheath gpL-like
MAEFNIPGVYSKVDASAAVSALNPNDNTIAIIATGTADDTTTQLTNKAYAPFSFKDAEERYGTDSNIAKLMKVSMENGGKKFIIVRVGEDDVTFEKDYQTALDVAELEEAIDILIVDSTDPTDFDLVKTHCKKASENRKERIAFVGFAIGTDINVITQKAGELNTGNVYTFFPNVLDINGNELPGIFGAAALAGQVAAELDPSMPMTNVEVNGFFGLSQKLKDSEMDALIVAGVIPLEVRNGSIRIVRAISTYTKDDSGLADTTWQELTTVRITHYVFKDLREALQREFSRAKQGKNTRDAIKSKVLTRLYAYQTLEYIENVINEDVSIEINPTNPLRNDVDFKYDVTGPMNVIHLTGHLVI